MYLVRIASTSSSSAVDVAKLQDLEQAISFGFQLHQISSCKHYILVIDEGGKAVASFIRTDTFTLPNPKSSDLPKDSTACTPAKNAIFGLKKRS